MSTPSQSAISDDDTVLVIVLPWVPSMDDDFWWRESFELYGLLSLLDMRSLDMGLLLRSCQ
ncbi:uncharacterized protein LAESUDRAFT_762098 [Laetiporus sulphureus 93-53]|uniref:Uncharacterized protein n=1 Tax=Laetiporus sulphureus 93-53 TaxID=1314785 RepID=A0A165CRS8_9APHY|nr:uncharacterized protein LAESUDRAFT_762098 [Laetiporus sulphureus 93-53]KZT03319.1 hypothetical protein LAESUDRAFT_762098 [Laetiporus sulphureus 93-53]